MTVEIFLDGRVVLHCGDCLDVMAQLPENSVDSIVCDPPYHLQSIHKRFDKTGRTDKTRTTSGPHQRTARGFMNKLWDGGDVAFRAETWEAALRVLKPGGYLVAFGGTRTYHRLACAVEDAGFEIRDTISWLFGSGFPKSLDISKAIDKAAGANRTEIRIRTDGRGRSPQKIDNHGEGDTGIGHADGSKQTYMETAPATDAARRWQGFGTALKPAMELIVLARKPLIGTNVENVLEWGTGALNIDECRIGTDSTKRDTGTVAIWGQSGRIEGGSDAGRWPANVVHDGSDDVVGAFPDTGVSSGGMTPGFSKQEGWTRPSHEDWKPSASQGGFLDSGSAARFFYSSKADADDRLGSKHPTIKPLDLMQWLVRLVTPPKGTVLDCFAGTGTTGEAAFRESMKAILIEREAEYQKDIRHRMALVLGGAVERRHAAVRHSGKKQDAGPLFAGEK